MVGQVPGRRAPRPAPHTGQRTPAEPPTLSSTARAAEQKLRSKRGEPANHPGGLLEWAAPRPVSWPYSYLPIIRSAHPAGSSLAVGRFRSKKLPVSTTRVGQSCGRCFPSTRAQFISRFTSWECHLHSNRRCASEPRAAAQQSTWSQLLRSSGVYKDLP